MKISLKKFKEGSLKEFQEIVKLEEGIDYGCFFVTAEDDNGKLIGLAGFNTRLQKYPVFEHILISPAYQKTSLVVRILKKMEDFIFNDLKQGCYLSEIKITDKRMINYAIKWGMKKFQENGESAWYFKTPQHKESLSCA